MPPLPGHWHSLLARHARSLREAFRKASQALENQLSTGQPQAKLETILVRNAPKHPVHPLARIRQTQSRWFSTARGYLHGSARNFTTQAKAADRVVFAQSSRVGAQIAQSAGRAPFASTLRPNVTGGTLGRTAGGYTLGGSGRIGGARHFSHGPATQTQVVQNVSQAVRAFVLGGQKAQFNGFDRRGEKQFKAVSALQESTGRKMRELPRATPGSRLEFKVNPTITALTPLTALAGFSSSEDSTFEADHLNSFGLLDCLSVDFSRSLKDLAAVLNDLKRLSALGDLPITYEGSSIRVHFPGCDADTVERICDELNVLRGTVVQDEEFDAFVGTEIALLFPFAPSEADSEGSCESWFDEPPLPSLKERRIGFDDMLSPAYSTQSDGSYEDVIAESPIPSSASGYESVPSGSYAGGGSAASVKHDPLEYQGFEGIYRFIEELDAVRS